MGLAIRDAKQGDGPPPPPEEQGLAILDATLVDGPPSDDSLCRGWGGVLYYSRIFSSTSQNSMTKKTTKGDRHATLKVIQRGGTIAKY